MDAPSAHDTRGMEEKECSEALRKALRSPSVETVLSRLRGVHVDLVSQCPEGEQMRGYVEVPPGDRIVLCCNLLRNEKSLETTLLHESIHAYDHQQGLNLTNPMHLACSEIRSHSVADCEGYPWPFKGMCCEQLAFRSAKLNFGSGAKRACGSRCLALISNKTTPHEAEVAWRCVRASMGTCFIAENGKKALDRALGQNSCGEES